MTKEEYDTFIKNHLQSIAVLAVEAQQMDFLSEKFGEQVSLIQHDVTRVIDLHTMWLVDIELSMKEKAN